MQIYNKHTSFDHVAEFLNSHYMLDDTTIVLGYLMCTYEEILELKNSTKRLIILQLEQVSPHLFDMNPIWLDILYAADEIWDYDNINAQILKTYGLKVSNVIRFSYTKSLDRITHIEKDIDVLFYGSINNKRLELFDSIKAEIPYSLNIVTDAFGSVLDDYISRSKIILNCHYYETDVQEQVRIFYPLCNGSCVVSEHNEFNNFDDSIFDVKRENIPVVLHSILRTEAWKTKMKFVRERFI